MSIDPFESDLVRSFRFVENQFLQVLLSNFELRRRGVGVELSVKFGEDSPTISTRRIFPFSMRNASVTGMPFHTGVAAQ